MNVRNDLARTALCVGLTLALGACGGSSGGSDDSAPDQAAAFESPDPARAITRAIVVGLYRELEDTPASLWMEGVAVSFEQPIDTDTLLRSVDAPLSVVAAMDAEGCLLIDDVEEIERIGQTLLEGEADERGETVLLSTAAGSLGELTLETGKHGENDSFDVRPGDLPRSARIAIVGNGTAFGDVAVPWLAPPSRFVVTGYDVSTHDPYDDATGPILRADSELRWDTVADGARVTMVSAYDIDWVTGTDDDGEEFLDIDVVGLVHCVTTEADRFVFPPGARAWMEARGFESHREHWGMSRIGWTVVRDGATALVATHEHSFGVEMLDGIRDDTETPAVVGDRRFGTGTIGGVRD